MGGELLRTFSPSQEKSEVVTPARSNNRVSQLQQDNLNFKLMGKGLTPEQLTSAEAARKEMEHKLQLLKESQEAELKRMRDELAAQKEATERERLALETAKREHEKMVEAEKEELVKRKRQEEEREQRERLKEWLAREQLYGVQN